MGSHKKDPAEWKIKRNRNGREHIDACKSGYGMAYPYMQVHHIVPVETMADATIEAELTPDEAEFVKKCLMITEWNINAEPNVVGMPVKRVYWMAAMQNADWEKWPCHLVDHNPYYNKEVIDDLTGLWRDLKGNAEECDVTGQTVAEALKAKSDKWRTNLSDRAKRGGPGDAGGILYCWEHREELSDWYRPFSMADKPQPRQAPKDWAKLSKDLEAYVKAIFEHL